MSNELICQLALELIPGIGPRVSRQLIGNCGTAKDVFRASKKQLIKIPGIGEKTITSIKTASSFREAEKIINQAEKKDIKLVHYTDNLFPKRLGHIPDSPNIIYQYGNGDLNPKHCVAIVGTRKASSYGKKITEQIVSELSAIGATVISGFAYGIDICAHKAAIVNELPTLAVLAGGVDHVYPSAHKKYIEEIIETGGLISEYLPGTKPEAHHFPTRNRIIAGLAEATIVIEAAHRGGALITAQLADSYQRPVFAVPGNLANDLSQGTNQLIAIQKALIYTGIQDLFFHLGWDTGSESGKEVVIPELSEDEEAIFNLLRACDEALEIDQITLRTHLSIGQVSSVLLSLEFKNLIKCLPGKKYELN